MGKAFEKQIKTIEDQGKKQNQALKDINLKDQPNSIGWIFPKGNETEGIKDELVKLKDMKTRLLEIICFMI